MSVQTIMTNSSIPVYYQGWAIALALALPACSPTEVKPVDIYPEDMCAHCRMAISDERFASEIIGAQGEVFKFDDIGCMENFKSRRTDIRIEGAFHKDFETRAWVPASKATIIETDIFTPMSSGKVAFADPVRAKIFAKHSSAAKK